MSNILKHYGTPRHSGRYPWGSGGDSNQRTTSFRSEIQKLKAKGLSEVEIAKGQGMNTSQLRKKVSLVRSEERAELRSKVLRMKEHGYSNLEIGRKLGKNESTIRSLLDPVLAERAAITRVTANMLKDNTDKYRYIDIGSGVETQLGISRTKLNTAIAELQNQGYRVHNIRVPQVGIPNQYTVQKALCAPDVEWKEVAQNSEKIKPIFAESEDYGRSYKNVLGLEPIQSVKSNRIKVRYAEEGGTEKDGVIELRRGTSDLDLGGKNYAQVRISVDGTHFLKGMAMYSDNMPDGVDIVFNTNKSNTGTKTDAFKKYKDDPDNPFGATIRKQKGALNIVNEEGTWDTWSNTLSSQILSKQPVPLAKKQLDLALKQRSDDYNEIMQLTNPIVKRQLLNELADKCDSASVHLKAASLPRQASKVILPLPFLKETEVYAPSFKDGESVVLIRHPHGGRFEIPELKVNSKSKAARALLGDAIDAIGINPKVAQQLSGADFDGDAVLIIPNRDKKIKTAPMIKALKDFDPKTSYPGFPGMKKISEKTKQTKMGEVSNLITDMTIKGAPINEIARAIKHSMVVIDAEKHNLNYVQSYKDQGIAGLSARYQKGPRGGASTLISRASSNVRVPLRKAGKKIIDPKTGKTKTFYIDPKTGEKLYTEVYETYKTKAGKVLQRMQKSTKMAEVKDARKLSSGTPMEEAYAVYANSLKALANKARLQSLVIKPHLYSPSARKVYEKEVSSLNAQLNIALKNKPLERRSQILANSEIKRKRLANPNLDEDGLKKIKNAALAEARTRLGAKKRLVVISDKEWEAIQAGAITQTKLIQILQNSDMAKVRQLATPRSSKTLSTSQINRAKTLKVAGKTSAEIAEALGVTISSLQKALDDERR